VLGIEYKVVELRVQEISRGVMMIEKNSKNKKN
jgi:hypothetical protein